MRRNALPQPHTLALAIGLALANFSVQAATCTSPITGAVGPCDLSTTSVDITNTGAVTGTPGTDGGSTGGGGIAGDGGAAATGISNVAANPALTNRGTVTGGSAGNGGSAGSGGIAGYGGAAAAGINSSGSISTLNNYGTFTGGAGGNGGSTGSGGIAGGGGAAAAGINNAGSITTLNNYGTLMGGAGGANGGFGGFGGASNLFGISNSGTITNLVNGQNNLTYSGTLPGNYYSYFSNASTFGKISFASAGTYTLSNYGLRIATGQNYAAGTYTGVIASDSALTISAFEAVSGVTYYLVDAGGGLNWNLVIDSVTSSRVFDGASALGNTPAYNAARVIDANANLLALFAPLNTNAQLSSAASQTTPVFTGDGQLVARATLGSMNRLINDRIAGNLGLASGDSFYGDKHVWMRPFGSVADQDASNGVAGYKANSYGLVFGVDGSLSGDALRLGAAFAYAKSDVNGQDSTAPQSGNIDVYQLIGYGSYRLDDRTAVSFQADVGQNANDTRRAILFAGTMASASYRSLTSHLGAGVGRTYALGAGTTLTPTLRADYTWIKDDSHTETGAGLLNLSVNSRSSDALVVGVDGKLVHALNDRTSLIADLGVGYNTINDQASITSAFAGAPGAAFTTTGIKPSPWIGRGAVGVEYKAQNGLTITGRYDAEWRTSFVNQTASLNLRKAF